MADSVIVFEAGDEIAFNQESPKLGDPSIHFRIHRLREAKPHQKRQQEQDILQELFGTICSQNSETDAT